MPNHRPPSSQTPPTKASGETGAPRAGTFSSFGLAINRAELERIVLLSSLLFLAALLLVMGRTARDALFLTRFPVTWIAPMWITYGAVSAVVALGYERAIRRLPRAKFGTAFALFAATTYLGLRVLIGYDIQAAYFIFAIWCEVIANLTAMLSWTIAQDLYDARSAKRAFAWIGAGRITGTIVSGLAAGAIAPIIGTENLIFLLVFALLLVALLCRLIAKRHGVVSTNRRDEPSTQTPQPLSSSLKSRYVGAIAGTILVLFTVLTIGDYQFKAIARSTYPSRDELASFMGTFYGAEGFVGLFVQFVVTPRILKRWGVIGAAAALPLAFLGSSALLVILPSIATATILKTSDNALQFSIFDVTLQLLGALSIVIEAHQIDARGFLGRFGRDDVFDEVLALTNKGDIARNGCVAKNDASAEETGRGYTVANTEGLEQTRRKFLPGSSGGVEAKRLAPCAQFVAGHPRDDGAHTELLGPGQGCRKLGFRGRLRNGYTEGAGQLDEAAAQG